MNLCNKKIISLLTCFSLLVFNVLPVLGADTTITGDSDNASQIGQTNVRASVPSTFTVGIPKTVVIDAETNTASYSITCAGDISGNEYVSVIPDTSILLNQFGKSSVTAETVQSATKFRSDTYSKALSSEEVLMSTGITGSITITGAELSAGNWSGVLNFDITLSCSEPTVEATITNDSGNPISSTVSVLTGTEKDELINQLITDNVILAANDVKALVEVETETFEGTATAVFDVSEFATPGDTIFIYHYDSNSNTWELIGEEVVASDYTITGSFTSFSPVAFTVEHTHSYVKSGMEATCTEPGEITKTCPCGDTAIETTDALGHNIVNGQCTRCDYAEPGFYTLDKTIAIPWATLVEEYGLAVTTNYNSSTYNTSAGAPNVVFKTINPGNKPFKLIVDKSITKIGSYAFYCSGESDACYNMIKVTLPNTITSIGDYSFSDCAQLKEVNIPTSLQGTGYYAFKGSGIESVTVPESVTLMYTGCFQNCTSLKSVTWNSKADISSYTFKNCQSLTDVTMQNTTRLDDGVFQNCISLKKIVIPDTVVRICDSSEGAFMDCASLSDVTLSNKLTSLYGSTFRNCTSLKGITIPASMTSIGTFAFRNSGLEEITIPSTLTTINQGAFMDCAKLKTVHYEPTAYEKNGVDIFSGCTALTEFYFEGNQTYITDGMFKNCTSLDLAIPDTVTTIKSGALYNVPHITYNGEATGSPWGALSVN